MKRSPTPRRTHWKLDLLAAAALLGLTFLAYWNSLHGDFVFDDQVHIVENRRVTGTHSLTDVISGGIGWRQLLFLTYSANFYWGRLNPFGYHLVNVALHAWSAILVYFIIIQLAPEEKRRYIAFTGAAVFSVHTLLTSAVSYVAGRSSVLCGVFYLLAVLMFLKGRSAQALGPRAGYWAVALVAAFLGFQAKEEAITLPVFIAGVEWLRSKNRDWRYIAAPVGVVLIVLIVLRGPLSALSGTLTENRSNVTAGFDAVLAPAAYFRTYITAVVTYYFPRFIVPVHLSADPHILPVESWYSARFILPVLALGALAWIVLRYSRSQPLVSMGIAAILISPLLGYGVMPLADVVLEHRAYIPAFGIAILFGWFFNCIARKYPRARWAVPVAAVIAFTTMTIVRNQVWASNITVWQDAVEKGPDKPRPHLNLGGAYHVAGRWDDAVREYERALKLKPDMYIAQADIAMVQIVRGQKEEAERSLLHLIEAAPNYVIPYLDLGTLYGRNGDLDRALEILQRGASIDPSNAWVHMNIGDAFLMKREFARAIDSYKHAIYWRPDEYSFRLRLANAHKQAGDLAAAEEEFRALLDTEVEADASRNLALLATEVGDTNKAIDYLRRTVRVRPVYPDAHQELGEAYLKRGLSDPAAQEFQLALQQQPNDAPAAVGLATVLIKKGNPDGARRLLQAFLLTFGNSDSPSVEQIRTKLRTLE